MPKFFKQIVQGNRLLCSILRNSIRFSLKSRKHSPKNTDFARCLIIFKCNFLAERCIKSKSNLYGFALKTSLIYKKYIYNHISDLYIFTFSFRDIGVSFVTDTILLATYFSNFILQLLTINSNFKINFITNSNKMNF